MISRIFHAVFYDPIYNILTALMAVIPGGDVGVAVILLTVVIRVILLPFSLSAARTQRAMRDLEPKLKELRELHKDDKEQQALKTLELYRTERVNPFATILTVLIQLPVLLALYWVFWYEPFTTVNHALLYGFTPVPGSVSASFLGLIDMTSKSLLLAILASITQFGQARIALSRAPEPTGEGMQADFNRAMNMQLRYIFPILIGVIAYTTSAAIALYFVTTNVAGILQELYIRKKFASAPLKSV